MNTPILKSQCVCVMSIQVQIMHKDYPTSWDSVPATLDESMFADSYREAIILCHKYAKRIASKHPNYRIRYTLDYGSQGYYLNH